MFAAAGEGELSGYSTAGRQREARRFVCRATCFNLFFGALALSAARARLRSRTSGTLAPSPDGERRVQSRAVQDAEWSPGRVDIVIVRA